MSVEDLPETVKQHIINETDRDHVQEDHRLSVTELTGCLRRSWYRRKQPMPITIRQRWWFYRGNLLDDAWSPLFKRNQVRVTYPVPNNWPLTIVGRLDFIDEDGAIADWKTTDSNNMFYIEKNGPKEDNEKQLLFYCLCEGKDKARLYYISMKDVLKIELEVNARKLEKLRVELETNAVTLYTALINNEPPPIDGKHTPRFWECGVAKDGSEYCEFRKICRTIE